MSATALLHHLKQAGCLEQAKSASRRLGKVFTDCLAADHEDIIIVTDYGEKGSMASPILGAGYYLAARDLGLEPSLVAQRQKFKGDQAERRVEDALDGSGFGNIVIMTAHSLGSTPRIGKNFRKFAASRRHRFITCTGLGSLGTGRLQNLLDVIDIDYPALWRRAHLLRESFQGADELRVTTPAGTDLWLRIRGKEVHANDGRFVLGGKGGNLPAGEVYVAPRKKQVEGRIVVDGSSRSIRGTLALRQPLTLTVRDGEVVEVAGGRAARRLEESIRWAYDHSAYPWGIRRLSEFGLGLNPAAGIVGAMIVDEKALGTAHVAIGSNHWFGGTVYAIIHLDQVLRNPTVWLDGEPLDRSLYT